MRLCDLDEIKVCVDRQYENCHGYSGSKKAIYREAILAVKSILHSAKPIDAVEVTRCKDCKYMTQWAYGRYCTVWDGVNGMGDDGFCNYGERRGDNNNG